MKIAFIAVLVYGVAYVMNTRPKYDRVDGFYGGVVSGSGHPDCLRTLPEAAQLLDRFQRGSAEYRELELLLSKMACFKKDMMAPGSQVDATRYIAFETAHDRIPVAELCGLCLSQNIPSRDLDVSFQTWRDRGRELIRLIGVQCNTTDNDIEQAEKLFKSAYEDVYRIAISRCLKTDYNKQGQIPGDVGAFEPPTMQSFRTYDYMHGQASGWNGVV